MMKSFLAVSVFACLSGCAAEKVAVDVGDFDGSCQKNSDCVGVLTGEPACCPTDQAAINQSELSSYTAAQDGIDCSDSEEQCPVVGINRPTCEDSVCTPSSDLCDAGEECRGVDAP